MNTLKTPWLPRLDSDWEFRRLKDIATISIGWTPSTSQSEYFDGKNVWVTIADMNKKYVKDSKSHISDQAVIDSDIRQVPKGSLLYSFKLSVGKVSFADTDLYTNEAIASITPKDRHKVNSGFLYYVISDYLINNANENIYGAKLMNQGMIKNSLLALPSPDAQSKIANFLNKKTRILDKIITAKQHTHTHLSELRQAIITNAVLSRGDDAMNFQDTNVPWIGKIPAHWQIERIKGVSDIVLGKMLQSAEKESYSLKPYLRAQNIRWENVDILDVNEMWFSPNELSQYRLKKGDILVTEGGEVGRAALWHNELDECYIQNSVNRLRVKKEKVLPEYLLYVLESYGQAKVFEGTVNRVSIAHLTREKLKEYTIPLPPINEQKQIVKGIQKQIASIDNANTQLTKSISQLEEYRSSLISSVVGGKVEI